MIPEKFSKLMKVINDNHCDGYDSIYSIKFEDPIEELPIVFVYRHVPGYLIFDLRDAGFSSTIFASLQFEHRVELWVRCFTHIKNE